MITRTASILALFAAITFAPALPAQNLLEVLFGTNCNPGALQLALGTRAHRCDSSCQRYERAHWTVVCEQVRIPGCVRQVWVPPTYRTEWTCCGNPVQVLVCAGHYQTVRDADRFETRKRRVWQPARWIRTCNDC